MFHETSHGLTSLHGNPPLFVGAIQSVQVQPKLTVIDMSEKCSDTSLRNILAPTSRLYGSAIALTIILIGTIASRTVSFLTSTKTSLLSWKSNSGIPFAPGSKFGLSTSLWLREFLDRIGNTRLVKSLPTTTRRSYSPSRYTILPASWHCCQDSLDSTSSGKGI